MREFLFVAIPYLALVLAVIGGLYRYFARRFSYSSMSSQILENHALFWGSVPWHYGIIPILLAHLFSGLFPGASAAILRGHWRLLVLELIGISLGFFAFVGIVVLIVRRLWRTSLVHRNTSVMDGVLLALLLAQVVTGVTTAIFHRWGSLWYLNTATPWFWSIVGLHPDPGKVATLPGSVKFHMVNGYVLILLFPFTRLGHIFTVPLDYFWRAYQIVIWNRRTWRAPRSMEAAK